MKIFYRFIPFAVVITLLCGFTYLAVQQNYRQNGNDPQVQMVEDTVSALKVGVKAESLLGTTKVDIDASLSPYLMIFDKDGKIALSGAELDGHDPIVPTGTFEKAKKTGENRFSWEPESNVRAAVVLKYYKNDSHEGYVLAGRSMRELENRVEQFTVNTAIAWSFTMFAAFVSILFVEYIGSRYVKS